MPKERHCGFVWWDKRVTKFLRENLPERKYIRIFIPVYCAIREIDSDLMETRYSDEEGMRDRNLVETCAKYSGISINMTKWVMDIFNDMEIIEYNPDAEGISHLKTYQWIEEDHEFYLNQLLEGLQNGK